MKRLIVGLFAALLSFGGFADTTPPAPDVLVKNVTNEVLDIIRKDKDIQSGNTKKVIELVDAKVLPNFNFAHMTALAVGKDWRQATPAQQKTLTNEFKTLLVRTYSNALTGYKNQTIDFKPLKMAPTDTDVRVVTKINQPGGKPIDLVYSLEKVKDAWLVYDIEVAGVSLVTTYRGEFSGQVSNGGIDGLIKSLQTKNQSSPDKAAAKQ